MTKRTLTRDALRSLYPPMDDAFDARLERAIDGLSRSKGELYMKKKLSFGLALTLILALLVVGAVAAAVHWNVMDFLFGGERPQASFLVKDISAQTSDGRVKLTVNSALCDGDLLALDWTVRNTKPDEPVYLQVDDFTANGARLWTDGNDSFDCQWLPGWCNEGEMAGGESVTLPEEITGNVLQVELRVGVYRPISPVYQMKVYNEEEAAKKLAEGYHVIAEGDGFVLPDPETGGLMHCFGRVNEYNEAQYDRTELVVRFELDLAAARAAQTQLTTQESYAFSGCTARFVKALLTPAGLYLSLDVWPDDGQKETLDRLMDGRFELTDTAGNALEDIPWNEMEMFGLADEGGVPLHYVSKWVGLSRDDLPSDFALSWLSRDGGERYIMPVHIPE